MAGLHRSMNKNRILALVALLFVGTGLAVLYLLLASQSSTGPRTIASAPAVASGETRAPSFDHSALDRLFSTYVDENGWVDYDGLSKERPVLDSYLGALATADPASFPDDADRLAFWINAYNAFTVRDVLDDVYGKAKGVKEVSGFFDGKKHRAGGEELTLDGIETKGRDLGDPRIHFAVVCASTSCPKLQRFAYTADRLGEQLDGAARGFLADETRGLRLDEAKGRVVISPIFKWYAGDFAGATSGAARALEATKAAVSGGAVLDYVRNYAPQAAARAIEAGKPSVSYLDYDWSLNAQSTHRQTEGGR